MAIVFVTDCFFKKIICCHCLLLLWVLLLFVVLFFCSDLLVFVVVLVHCGLSLLLFVVAVFYCCCYGLLLVVGGDIVCCCTRCVWVGGAVQQRAAGQTAENHRCHQLVHVHLHWAPLTAGREQVDFIKWKICRDVQTFITTQRGRLTFWGRRCRRRQICCRTEALRRRRRDEMKTTQRHRSARDQADPPHLKSHLLLHTESTPERENNHGSL